MALPASFLRDGFQPADKARTRMKLPNGRFLKPLLIGTEGETDTGKTEFILSSPGPGIMICLDRGYEPLLDNPNPPEARRAENFAIMPISVPLNTTATQPTYLEYFNKVRASYYRALDNPDCVTVAVDGDSDFWELHTLASFGKITQIFPQTRYGDIYAQKRAMINKAWDTGKIIIATNRVTDEYETVYGPDGLPIKEIDGSDKKIKTGNKRRQGFKDQNYLWQIQIRHLYRPPEIKEITLGGKKVERELPGRWGLRILKCKANTTLVGLELWGDDCNFRGLVQTVYPNIDPADFGL